MAEHIAYFNGDWVPFNEVMPLPIEPAPTLAGATGAFVTGSAAFTSSVFSLGLPVVASESNAATGLAVSSFLMCASKNFLTAA